MKFISTAFSVIALTLPFPLHAQEDAWSYTSDELHPGEQVHIDAQERAIDLNVARAPEDNDPIEGFNRGVFAVNDVLDRFLFDRMAAMYRGVIPEVIRERVGYVLRNLSEPIVFTNNLLQGELGDAGDTLSRFLINSTVGVAGIFDVSTDWGVDYKKEDFGLTLASWGAGPGPYIVLPILGPSNLRDSFGRIGDYAFDPINWWAYSEDKAVYSNARTGAQILDAKADNLDLLKDLRNNSIDYYATIRTWYHERRKDLRKGTEERTALDTPRPDNDD